MIAALLAATAFATSVLAFETPKDFGPTAEACEPSWTCARRGAVSWRAKVFEASFGTVIDEKSARQLARGELLEARVVKVGTVDAGVIVEPVDELTWMRAWLPARRELLQVEAWGPKESLTAAIPDLEEALKRTKGGFKTKPLRLWTADGACREVSSDVLFPCTLTALDGRLIRRCGDREEALFPSASSCQGQSAPEGDPYGSCRKQLGGESDDVVLLYCACFEQAVGAMAPRFVSGVELGAAAEEHCRYQFRGQLFDQSERDAIKEARSEEAFRNRSGGGDKEDADAEAWSVALWALIAVIGGAVAFWKQGQRPSPPPS